MNSKQCKQNIDYLYGLYVYLTNVHICIHAETKVDYPHFRIFGLPRFIRVPESDLRQVCKTTASQALPASISLQILEIPKFDVPINRDINPSSN